MYSDGRKSHGKYSRFSELTPATKMALALATPPIWTNLYGLAAKSRVELAGDCLLFAATSSKRLDTNESAIAVFTSASSIQRQYRGFPLISSSAPTNRLTKCSVVWRLLTSTASSDVKNKCPPSRGILPNNMVDWPPIGSLAFCT